MNAPIERDTHIITTIATMIAATMTQLLRQTHGGKHRVEREDDVDERDLDDRPP